MDVMFYETFEEEQLELRKIFSDSKQAQFTSETIQESRHKHPPAKLISIRTQSRVPEQWHDQLEGVLTRSQGYDHLSDYKNRTGTKAVLGYLSEYCARSVAEHAIMSMMALQQKLKEQIQSFEKFNRDGLTGQECLNKNALVVGVGNIGSHIADMARGLRMNTKGVDVCHKVDGLEYVSLDDGLKDADVVFCALPLTDQTKGLLNYDCLKQVKKDAVLINVSRGEITPAEDMKRLLDEGILGGLAMDVFPDEKEFARCLRRGGLPADPNIKILIELGRKDNVVFTPHNAFNTEEALVRKSEETARAVKQFLKNKTFPTCL